MSDTERHYSVMALDVHTISGGRSMDDGTIILTFNREHHFAIDVEGVLYLIRALTALADDAMRENMAVRKLMEDSLKGEN